MMGGGGRGGEWEKGSGAARWLGRKSVEQGSWHGACFAQAARLTGSALSPGFDSRLVCKQLIEVLGKHVLWETRCLLREAAALSMMQDARDAEVVTMIKGVLWKMPKELAGLPVDGIKALTPDGPFVFTRVLSVWRMGAHRDAKDIAQGALQTLEGAAGGPGPAFEELKAKLFFSVMTMRQTRTRPSSCCPHIARIFVTTCGTHAIPGSSC